MRGIRAAKFAEYTSTYAILNRIGIHATALIERRDPSVGYGVYVRDACDSGTTLLVVPAHRICATSVLTRIGTRVTFHCPPAARCTELDAGLITFLTAATSAVSWMELCWRLALERHRNYSHWWGWLESVPPSEEFAGITSGATAQCRALYTPLYPFLVKARKRVEEEKREAHRAIAEGNLTPSFANFSWAVDVLLSRGLQLPLCWSDTTDGKDTAADAAVAAAGATAHETCMVDLTSELGIVPYVDLINGPDPRGREANAAIEVAADAEDLPEWYLQWILSEAQLKSRDGVRELSRVLEQRYCICVTLTRPLQASEEVILPYSFSSLTTGVLRADEDEHLTRLLKYNY